MGRRELDGLGHAQQPDGAILRDADGRLPRQQQMRGPSVRGTISAAASGHQGSALDRWPFSGEGNQGAWKLEDAPEKYVELLKRSIIGIEIVVERLEGKFKMSQELKEGDRQGVIDGFRKLGSKMGEEVADLVEERGELKKVRGS